MSVSALREELELLLWPVGPFRLEGDNLCADRVELRQIRLLDENDAATLKDFTENCKAVGVTLDIKWMSIPHLDNGPFGIMSEGRVSRRNI